MTPERNAAIKAQALKAIAAKAHNKNCPGVSLVAISPHEALEYVRLADAEEAAKQPIVLADHEKVDEFLINMDLHGYAKYEDHDDIILDGHYTLDNLKQIVAAAEGK